MIENTLALIKPDAVERNLIGIVIKRIEDEGFVVRGLRMLNLSKKDAEQFYLVHKERPFYGDLTDYMSSGTIVALMLSRENAVLKWREIMGATNPKEADEGTLRRQIGVDLEENSLHGSDSLENAKTEREFFFNNLQTRY